MPRYSRDAPSFLIILRKQSTMPLYASSPVALPDCSCLRVSKRQFVFPQLRVLFPSYTLVLTTSSGYITRIYCLSVSVAARDHIKAAYFRHAGNCAGGELVDEWKRLLFGRHGE